MRELNEAKSGVVDLFLVYQFLRRLATPFKKWPAYQAGVIDDKGEVIVKPKDRDQKQNQSFKIFDLMILKLKRLLGKIPGGKTRIASYAAALYLIKESKLNKTEEQIRELIQIIQSKEYQEMNKLVRNPPPMDIEEI